MPKVTAQARRVASAGCDPTGEKGEFRAPGLLAWPLAWCFAMLLARWHLIALICISAVIGEFVCLFLYHRAVVWWLRI